MSPAALLFDATWVARTSQALALAGSALGLAMGILAWRLGYTPARLYVLAFVTVILTGAAMVMRNLGLLPWTPLTAYGTQIGASLEALFLGLALAERIRTVQAAALDASRRAEQGLEHEVAARTAELAAANGRLREEIGERERAEAPLRESEERLRRLAQHDALTGVANRNLLGDCGGGPELARVAGQFREAFEQPLPLVDGMLMPRARFGAALFPEDGDDLDRLIAHADLEMYRDKQARRAISES